MAHPKMQTRSWLIGVFVVALPLCLLWSLMAQMSWRPHTFRATKEQNIAMAFAPDSNTLAISDGTMVKFWDVGGTIVKRILQTKHPVTSIAFSSDGKLLCSGGRDGALMLWNLASGQSTSMQGSTNNEITAVAFSSDSKSIVSNSTVGVKLWNAQTGKLQHTLLTGYFDSSGLNLVMLADIKRAGVQPWNLSSGFSADGKLAATSTFAGFGPDGPIQLWNVQTGKALHKFGSGYGTFFRLAFSPDSKTIASGSHGDVLLWDVSTGQLKQHLTAQERAVTVIAFSSDGSLLAYANDWGTVTIKRVQ